MSSISKSISPDNAAAGAAPRLRRDEALANSSVTVGLMGGLGNQMFQYAAGRALASRNSALLYVDAKTGFVNDKVYRRTYALSGLPVQAQRAGVARRFPFWYERARERFGPISTSPAQRRPWGTVLKETQLRYLEEVACRDLSGPVWMRGHWQSEKYFEAAADLIRRELSPPTPKDANFLDAAKRIEACSAVAVGMRLFEEMPGASKDGVGGLTPASFYESAARRIAEKVTEPVFFVFSTAAKAVLEKISFPGPVHYITPDGGYAGEIPTLWLMSRCPHHVLSNSSFYWWGAWLSEGDGAAGHIIASPHFTNADTVPARWTISA
jgi:hypothetical protein